jgi:hypothetical protein
MHAPADVKEAPPLPSSEPTDPCRRQAPQLVTRRKQTAPMLFFPHRFA